MFIFLSSGQGWVDKITINTRREERKQYGSKNLAPPLHGDQFNLPHLSYFQTPKTVMKTQLV